MAAEEQQLSPFSRLFHSPEFNCVVVVTMGSEVRIDPTVFVEGLKQTLIKHPRFSSKMDMNRGNRGKPVWVRTKVNVEDHVIVPDVDNDNNEDPDQFLEDYISNMTTIPMDISKPLWEFHLLNVKTSDAESVLVLKVHHSLGDGMSLMSLLLACCRKTSNPEALPTVAVKDKRAAAGSSSTFLGTVWWFVVGLWFLIRLISNTCVDVFKFAMTLWFLKDTETPIKGKPGVELYPKRVVHKIISLDDVKLVKNAMKMTVNDVLLGITQVGLSRYLGQRYETTSKPKKFLERIRLRGAIFMNLRPNARIEDLADMMAKGSKCRWGNWIGYVLLPFSITLEGDPLENVQRAKAAIDRKKLSLEAVLSFASVKLIMKVFGFKAVEAVVKRVFRNTTLTFSNVVGPTQEISFFGYPISYIAPSVYGHSHALTLHYQSYVNKMIISIAVDPMVISDPHKLGEDLVQSLETIKSAVLQRGLCNIEV